MPFFLILQTMFNFFQSEFYSHKQQNTLKVCIWRFCRIWAEKWILKKMLNSIHFFEKMIDYFRHIFKSSMKALIVKGKKRCLQNRHKRKHCWALDATVKIADARSEGQMFLFGEKSNLDFAFCIHRAHLVSKNFEEFCCHLLRWQIRIRKIESRCFLIKLESEFCFPADKGTLVAYVNSNLIRILT